MLTPPLIYYTTPEEYKEHYIKYYCREKIFTFDQIRVRFQSQQFAHSFYESSSKDGKKDMFSKERAERIDWIKATLENENAILYQGRDKRNNLYDANRRISVVYESYIVIIDITNNEFNQKPLTSTFVTAYPADKYAMSKIIQSPRWERKSLIC